MKKMFIVLFMCVSMIMCSGIAIAQDISGDSISGAKSDSMAEVYQVDNSINTSNVYDRKFVGSGPVPFPQTNGFFTAPTPDSSFRSIKDVLRAFAGPNHFMIRMTEGALQNWAKGGKATIHFQVMRDEDIVVRVYGDDYKGSEKWLWVGIEEPVFNCDGEVIGTKRLEGLEVTSMVDGEAKEGKTNSLQVIGRAGLKAIKDGNNFMVITAEGAHRMVQASGWGIGGHTTGGLVNQSSKESVIGGGGTGYSNNKTGPEDKPWIQGYAGVMDMPELHVVVEEESKQTGNHISRYGGGREGDYDNMYAGN